MAGPERRSRLISEREKRGHRLPRGWARAGRARAAEHRPGAQDLDHPARPRARLHAHAPDRGQVPRDAAASCVDELAMLLGGRTAEELIFADPTTGRAERHRPRHHDRPADGHRVRHERRARPDALRSAAGRGVPRPRLHVARPTTPTRSRPASTPRCARCIDGAHAAARAGPRPSNRDVARPARRGADRARDARSRAGRRRSSPTSHVGRRRRGAAARRRGVPTARRPRRAASRAAATQSDRPAAREDRA